jgi:putative flavoprotein involved in K+ transport
VPSGVHLPGGAAPVPWPGHHLLADAAWHARTRVRTERPHRGAAALPRGAVRLQPPVSGADGGHDIHLRDLGRRGVRLHGHLEAADDGELVFSDDLPERLALVEAGFSQRLQPMFDAYIAAAGISAPTPEPPRVEDWLPSEPARLNLDAENITSVIWATGYRLDFSILDIPVLDEWNYPRHIRGVIEHPGLYAVGLPWLTGHGSSIVAGEGRDAAYIAEHIAGR